MLKIIKRVIDLFSKSLVKEPGNNSEQVIRTLYLPLVKSDEEADSTIKLVKDDFYFKGNETGHWKMITNEVTAVEDNVFIVTVISYDEETSVKYANLFADYLVRWYKFTEIKNHMTSKK